MPKVSVVELGFDPGHLSPMSILIAAHYYTGLRNYFLGNAKRIYLGHRKLRLPWPHQDNR